MHRIPAASRRVLALVMLALAVMVLIAAASGWLTGTPGDREPQRPAPDAPVRVVKAPAEPAVDRMPACRSCVAGTPGLRL
jgi:hypothetical protein